MNKINVYIALFMMLISMKTFAQQKASLVSKETSITFFSNAPLEDIEAKSI
jgi:hypothetical protein